MPQPTRSNRARQAMNMDADQQPQAGTRPSAGTDVDVVENRIARTRRMREAFDDAMPRGMEATMLIRDAITAIRTVPKLARATEESFFGALMTAAQLGLRPNVGSIGHGWVLPYENRRKGTVEAQWILGYQGMVELAWRSQLVSGITAHTIFEGETYKVRYGTDDVLEHEPILAPTKGRVPIAHYAVVRLVNGGRVWHVMSEAETLEIMSRSAAARDGRGPWIDDPLPMKRKSALRALWRFTPKSEAMAIAIQTDEQTRLVDAQGTALPDEDEVPAGAPEPERDTITVTRVPHPDPAAETVDASPAETEARRRAPQNAARRKLLVDLEALHGPRWEEAVRHALDDAHKGVPSGYLTDEELAAGLAFDLQAYDDAQIDAAAAKDGL